MPMIKNPMSIIGKGGEAVPTVDLIDWTSGNVADYYSCIVPIDDTRFVVAYNGSGSSTLYAVVGTITENGVSFGTALMVTSSANGGNGMVGIKVADDGCLVAVCSGSVLNIFRLSLSGNSVSSVLNLLSLSTSASACRLSSNVIKLSQDIFILGVGNPSNPSSTQYYRYDESTRTGNNFSVNTYAPTAWERVDDTHVLVATWPPSVSNTGALTIYSVSSSGFTYTSTLNIYSRYGSAMMKRVGDVFYLFAKRYYSTQTDAEPSVRAWMPFSVDVNNSYAISSLSPASLLHEDDASSPLGVVNVGDFVARPGRTLSGTYSGIFFAKLQEDGFIKDVFVPITPSPVDSQAYGFCQVGNYYIVLGAVRGNALQIGRLKISV